MRMEYLLARHHRNVAQNHAARVAVRSSFLMPLIGLVSTRKNPDIKVEAQELD